MKERDKSQFPSLRGRLYAQIGLPPEVTLDAPHIVWTCAPPGTGRAALLVEGHGGILELTDREVRLQTAHLPLYIRGDRLRLQQLNAEKLLVYGDVCEVTLERAPV